MCTCVGLTRPGGGAACALRTHPEACTATCTAAATAAASSCQSPARTGARKRTHERTPHSVATNSTSAGSRPSCRGHIPMAFSCEHTGPPRSNVADGNQQSPPIAAVPTNRGYCVNRCTTVRNGTRPSPFARTDLSVMPPIEGVILRDRQPCVLACPHAAVPNKRRGRTRVKAACQHHMADTACANRPMRHERGDPSRSASPAHKSNICTTPAARLPGGRARSHAWTPPPSRHVHATIRSTSEVPTLRFRFPAPMRVGNGALRRRCCFRRKSFRSHSAGGGEKGGGVGLVLKKLAS